LRLTSIKLAGFKSFVDPTTIPIPAQLTGVVGPNGCGKSNVIDAVRWVLGESSAKHLRGESMQDVIFNGSSARKPVSRASVELIFDNSQGKASGQWSQYGEISVKRVLTRNGDSSYYINNLHVRRRDVADLFMGTGLGARAYAIIEQGMISRVIEAKPEELRAYLEEAAGISKYKERRKETEARLRDARDNLNRVEDIRQELDKQIEKLSSQAEIAKQYKAFQEQLTVSQHMLWYVKKRDAQAARGRLARDLGEAGNRLEAETARLREIEAQLETTRNEHYASQDSFNVLQGEYYSAQSEVSRIEQALGHLRTTRERLSRQQGELETRNQSLNERIAAAAAEKESQTHKLANLADLLAQAEARLTAASSQHLPEKEEALRQAQQAVGEAQRELSNSEQNRQVDETHLAHAKKTVQQLEERKERLDRELAQLPRPDAAALSAKEAELAELAETLAQARMQLEGHEAELPALDHARSAVSRELDEARRESHRIEAELSALTKLQESLKADEKLGHWLAQQNLAEVSRIWQRLDVEPGWEAAVEAVLRERLQALDVGAQDSWFSEGPPARMTVFDAAGEGGTAEAGSSLLGKLRATTGSLPGAVNDWLAGVLTADGVEDARRRQNALQAGQCLVTPQGHVFTRHSVTFHGPHTAVESVLARSRDIEHLGRQLVEQKARMAEFESALQGAQSAYTAAQQAVQQLRQQVSQAQSRHQSVQMEVVRFQQAVERVTQRRSQIENELADIENSLAEERAESVATEERLHSHRTEIDFARERVYEARQARDIADRAVHEAREMQREAERSLQETRFIETTAANKISELTALLASLEEEKSQSAQSLASLQQEMFGLDEAPLETGLQNALAARVAREESLGAARNALEEMTNRLRNEDEARVQCEQGLTPLRERMEQLRLKDQELLLTETQFEENLKQAQADQEALKVSYEQTGPKAGPLQSEINRLSNDIAALGAVNLAALDELTEAQERGTYLANQHADLLEATNTLEAAIKKIDQETRELLKATFDTVNANLGELFPQFFGGGRAELVLTGEELLDAGVQIIAQPPGKKNASIHLLSGGEKALTALSLVFALFKLNPAPFCLLDEVDAPLDDANTVRYSEMVKRMSSETQFLFITHNRITMEMAQHLAGVTMNEPGVSRIVAVDVQEALRFQEAAA
jgi:chromosome segregation protein